MMKCSDTQPLLDLLCDDALDAKDCALVLDHLKSCPQCQSEFNDLEELRSRFHEAKDKPLMSVALMNRISTKLKDEERAEQQRFFKNLVKPVPMLAIAAAFALVGFFLLPWLHQSDTRTVATASTDSLIEDLASNSSSRPVMDRSELGKRLGYDLKYLQLPTWRMDKSSVYQSGLSVPIARFDFVRKGESGTQHLTCYQAPQGVIRANGAESKTIGGKRVLFGNHAHFQFALWSQDGRDYLVVTALPKPLLEEFVRRA